MYKLIKSQDTNQTCAIRKTSENDFVQFIPINEDNTDYQEYLAWLAEGNEPEPADE